MAHYVFKMLLYLATGRLAKVGLLGWCFEVRKPVQVQGGATRCWRFVIRLGSREREPFPALKQELR